MCSVYKQYIIRRVHVTQDECSVCLLYPHRYTILLYEPSKTHKYRNRTFDECVFEQPIIALLLLYIRRRLSGVSCSPNRKSK